MVDLWRDFWIRETGTGQQVAQLHERYIIIIIMIIIIIIIIAFHLTTERWEFFRLLLTEFQCRSDTDDRWPKSNFVNKNIGYCKSWVQDFTEETAVCYSG